MATAIKEELAYRTLDSFLQPAGHFVNRLCRGPRPCGTAVFGKQFLKRHALGVLEAIFEGRNQYQIQLTGGEDLKEAFPGLSGNPDEDRVEIARRLGEVFNKSDGILVDLDSKNLLGKFFTVTITLSW